MMLLPLDLPLLIKPFNFSPPNANWLMLGSTLPTGNGRDGLTVVEN
jgi:hypothetical protein